MAETRTVSITRPQIAKWCQGDEILIRAVENLLQDVGVALPGQLEGLEESQSTVAESLALLQSSSFYTRSESDLDNARELAFDSRFFDDEDDGETVSVTSTDRIAILEADKPNSTTNLVVGGMEFDLTAGTYEIEGVLTFQSSSTTAGIGITLDFTGQLSGGFTHPTSVNTLAGSYSITPGAVKGTTSAVTAINEDVPAQCRWIVVLPADGSVSLLFRSSNTSTITIKAGTSYLRCKRLTA